MRAIFRCDSSSLIGSGHVIRCRTLARQLRKEGIESYFVCRNHIGNFNRLLNGEFTVYELITLKGDTKPNDESKDINISYIDWLGCNQEIDALETFHAIKQLEANHGDWIIIDHYGINSVWQNHFLDLFDKGMPRICVIDDLANRKHNASILIDQSYTGNPQNNPYKKLTPKSCISLLGPAYALLDNSFAIQKKKIRERSKVKRVLVYFGSVDKFRLTNCVLDVFNNEHLKDIAVDVVLPDSNANFKEVQLMCNERGNSCLHSFLPNLAELISNADLAIGAVGSTTWERICLELPTVAITVADNQQLIAQELNRKGYIYLIGNACKESIDNIADKLHEFLKQPIKLKVGPELTDGSGAKLVSLALSVKTNSISLRPVQNTDEGILFRWANESAVRKNSFSPKEISIKEHRDWFLRSLDNANRIQLIAETRGCKVGQIRFDREKYGEFAADYWTVSIDISLEKALRGKGLSSEIVLQGIEHIKTIWKENLFILACVLNTNGASNGCFKNSGFKKVEPSINGITRWYKSVEFSQ